MNIGLLIVVGAALVYFITKSKTKQADEAAAAALASSWESTYAATPEGKMATLTGTGTPATPPPTTGSSDVEQPPSLPPNWRAPAPSPPQPERAAGLDASVSQVRRSSATAVVAPAVRTAVRSPAPALRPRTMGLYRYTTHGEF